MAKRSYKRLDLAEHQLEAAVGLFVSGGDRFSVISLAGAADVILSRLVIARGEKNFTEHVMDSEREEGRDPGTREGHGRHINDMFHINAVKHMDADEDGYIEMNPDESALGAVLKALANYTILKGTRKHLVLAFRAWARTNLDPKKYNIESDPNWQPQNEEA